MRAALIGTGQIAQQHLACLRALPGITLVGVCDLSRAMAESAAERFGVAAWFTDHRAMLDAVRPDIVHITTPPASHFRLAMDALTAGSHVIVEKPATAARAELDVLLRSASQAGGPLPQRPPPESPRGRPPAHRAAPRSPAGGARHPPGHPRRLLP